MLLLLFPLNRESRLLNLDLAGDCTFIPTEWQQSIAGNYSLIILQVSTLRPRDKNKMHACPNKLQVVLNTCEWIWQTNVLCYRHFRLSLENVLCFHVPVISSTWFSFGSLHCLDYKLKQNKTKIVPLKKPPRDTHIHTGSHSHHKTKSENNTQANVCILNQGAHLDKCNWTPCLSKFWVWKTPASLIYEQKGKMNMHS